MGGCSRLFQSREHCPEGDAPPPKNRKIMTIKEILKYEDANVGTIRIHREGMFAKAYEKSAFLLSHLKPLKPTVKFIKSEGREVVSVGMPTDIAMQLLKDLPCEGSGMTLVYRTESVVDETGYAAWRKEAGKATALRKTVKKEVSHAEDPLYEAIRNFDIAKSTPIDCMNFIVRQKELLQERC